MTAPAAPVFRAGVNTGLDRSNSSYEASDNSSHDADDDNVSSNSNGSRHHRGSTSSSSTHRRERDGSPPGLTNSTGSPSSSTDEDFAASARHAASAHQAAFHKPQVIHGGNTGAAVPLGPGMMGGASAAVSVGAGPVAVGGAPGVIDGVGVGAKDALANAQAWHQMDFTAPHSAQGGIIGGGGGQVEEGHRSDAMFEEMIQADSFDPPTTGFIGAFSPNTVYAATPHTGASQPTPASYATTSPQQTPQQQAQQQSQQEQATPQSQHGNYSLPASMYGSGSHYSHTSDSDLGYTSTTIVRPKRAELEKLQVHVHGVALSGAKSRVETQIRMRLELVRPVPPGPNGRAGEERIPASSAPAATPDAKATAEARFGPPAKWQRIGSFTHIKLPPMTGTRRKSKKSKQMDVDPEKTLFVDATVVNATPPHQRVFVCDGCRARERKRVYRKKSSKKAEAARAKAIAEGRAVVEDDEANGFKEPDPTPEEMKEMGIDPDSPNALAKARDIVEERAKKRVVLFNCGDYVDFETGEAVLPTRITCYCRHHKEKIGFCIIFTMRDWTGELLATGTTPPIMITDDHKTVTAHGQAGPMAPIMRMVSGSTTPQPLGPIRQSISGRSRAPSEEDKKTAAPMASRGKPYARPFRSVSSSGQQSPQHQGPATATSPLSAPLSMTTNGPSPASAIAESPKSNAMFDQVNATGENLSRLSEALRQGAAIHGSPPGETANPVTAHPQLPIQAAQNSTMRMMPPNAAQGSLSPHTLQTMPHSEPNFDFSEFISMPFDPNAAISALGIPAAPPSSSGHSSSMATDSIYDAIMNAGNPPGHSADSANHPLPKISRLIPAEGPTTGGIEVTVLGENFIEGITCVFGDTPAISTKVWASNTLVCVLPPSASPGPVIVSFKLPTFGLNDTAPRYTPGGNNHMAFFNYVEMTDRSLMELALQVVGLQMTGQMQSARDVAMRVVGSQQGQQQQQQQSYNSGDSHQLALAAALRSRSAAGTQQSFQDSVITFLTVLDAEDGARTDALRLANSRGQTLLHLAVHLGLQRLVDDLLRRGAPVNARDGSGFTALHFASMYGKTAIARRLLQHGASPDVINAAGRSPLDVALEHEEEDIVDLLDEQIEIATSRSITDSGLSLNAAVDVDEDNLSSSDEEELDDSEDQSDDASESEAESSPATKKEAEAASEKVASRLLGMPTLNRYFTKQDIGGFDWAQKFSSVQAILPTMHMPAVPVFHVALPTPSALMPWPPAKLPRGNSDQRILDGETTDSEDGHGKVKHLWRTLLDQAPWVASALSGQPPPTYETAVATSPVLKPAFEDHGEGSSTGPGTASDDTYTSAVEPIPSMQLSARPKSESNSRRSSTSRKGKAPVSTTTPQQRKAMRGLREDRMLMWFWLPALTFILVLLLFSSSTSIFSLADLLSYIPLFSHPA